MQWIVIDFHNKSGTESLHLRVMAHQLNSKNDVVIIDQDLSLLVEDETRGLLINQSGDVPKTYFLISTLSLDQPGCLGIHAVVTEAGSPLYDGQTIVSVH